MTLSHCVCDLVTHSTEEEADDVPSEAESDEEREDDEDEDRTAKEGKGKGEPISSKAGSEGEGCPATVAVICVEQ